VKEGKSRLNEDFKKISENITKEIQELLLAKE
jgi:hypothetical protein